MFLGGLKQFPNVAESFITSHRMVRTKGDGGASRTVASKAPRKALGGGGSSSSAASRAISAAAGAGSGRSGGFCAVS